MEIHRPKPSHTVREFLSAANEQEFRDGSALFLNGSGGPLSELERERILGAAEALRRDNEEIVRLVTIARSAMARLIQNIRPSYDLSSPMQDKDRLIKEMESQPMAQRCLPEFKRFLQQK